MHLVTPHISAHNRPTNQPTNQSTLHQNNQMNQVSASTSNDRRGPAVVIHGVDQRLNARHLGRGLLAEMVLELTGAVLRDANHLWELHLSGPAPGRGVPPQGETSAALAHPGM